MIFENSVSSIGRIVQGVIRSCSNYGLDSKTLCLKRLSNFGRVVMSIIVRTTKMPRKLS